MTPTPGPVPGTVNQVGTEDPTNYIRTSRKSMTVSTKGLLNMPGQNNCFLNSAVQVLWHLDAFRRSFRELSGHACMAESCIFCALKELFTQFQYSQESALPPDALRHALAKTFCDQRRFQLGFMDDAAECFENILLRIHVHIANQETDDMCGNAHCIPHQKFAMTLVEQRVCHSCGATSEPMPFTQMVHYVTTSALCAKTIETLEQDMNKGQNPFGTLLRLAGDMGEVRNCSNGCGAKIQVRKTLMNHPEVVSIGLVWDSENPTLQHITDVFNSIGMYLNLQDMFNYVFDMEWANLTTHQLVGVVTYYGKHYSTFFFHTKLRVWIYFDDATVREVGPSWEQVVDKCQKGRFQPLLLLFASPNSYAETMIQDQSLNNNYSTDVNRKLNSPLNQRQAVINQFLMFQNSFMNSKLTQDHRIIDHNNYPTNDHRLPLSQTQNPSFYHKHGQAANSQSPSPVYSNLEYLNASQHYHHEQTDILKLNEVSLPLVNPMTCSKNSSEKSAPMHYYDSLTSYDVSNSEKKDHDGAKDSDSAYTEDDPDMYITRKTVESVLNHQKRQLSLSRSYSQSSVGNRNSSSSLESFDHPQNKFDVIKTPPSENVSNRRDSGTWSSDRNSSSSNNSSENPFLTVVASKRLLLGLNNVSKKNQLPDYSNTNSSDHGYDSFSVSSSDSYPSINGSPVKLDPRLTQIPEDWQPEEEEEDLDKKLKLITEDASGPPDCDKLCAEADLLLAKSHEKEKDGDLVMAALLCDSAAARARAAMEAPYNNSRSLVSAKMKHSTCVMRSSNLYRRLKDHELDERRKQKSHTGHHSRQSSRDSTHSRHSRQSSKDSTHSKSGSKDTNHNSDEAENFGKNIEIYGTLPKKGSRKKGTGTSVSTKAKDDQIYKDFLDKQRKNTNLSTALNETMMKNVDLPHSKPETNQKSKSQSTNDKHQRKNSAESTPKSPTRKKTDPSSKSEGEHKKKVPKQQSLESSYVDTIPSNEFMENEMFARDLMSPINSPDKKQHKIKRKLMGGFMKRKNRSLPDLREDQDLNDPMDHFLDDAIIQVPSTITMPNGKVKKIGGHQDGVGNVTRGFHQPHHAFVKKDLTQRPLLMKVNPPNIQSSLLSNPKSKLTHALPSIPKKSPEIKENFEMSSPNSNGKPSKIPFIPTIQKNEVAVLPPLPSFKPPETTKCLPKPSIPQKISSIPILSPPQAPVMPPKNNVPKESMQDIPSPPHSNSLSSEDDIPQPSNPFLEELQAKRKQVLNRAQQKKEAEVIKPYKNSSQPLNMNKDLSLLPKLTGQSEGKSWLKELQSKQQQILKKQDNISPPLSKPNTRFDKTESIKTSINSPKDSETVLGLNKPIPNIIKHQKNSESDCTKDIPPKDKDTTNKTSSSVKDLASRFEKVLIKPKEPIALPSSTKSDEEQKVVYSKENSFSSEIKRTPQDGGHSTIIEKVPHPILEPRLPLKSALKVRRDGADSTNLTAKDRNSISESVPFQTNIPNLNSSDSISSKTSGQIQRPMQPPDYATAMQRLELMKTQTSDGNVHKSQGENFSHFVPKTYDPPKKKSGPKKTVTFSDEVVLVACAEYDEIDFSSNPLFERVYQQHVESGKGEIPILSQSYGNFSPPETSMHDNSLDEHNTANNQVPSPCNLCHNKYVIQPSLYCSDCEFYLSRYKP